MKKPVIAIIGRPNVGKSTLFNRLTKTRDALVADIPGLTRDRHYGSFCYHKKEYLLIDTGGFEPLVQDGIIYQMAKQTEHAIIEADVIIFVVDGRLGATAQDTVIANKLRVTNKSVYIAVNKVEGIDHTIAISDFYSLGFTNLYAISSSHGDGVYDLIDAITREFKGLVIDDALDLGITFAIVGRPNVGKSTLVNAILGEERVIVFDEAGTTRDSISISFNKLDQKYTIIDTAGIRRKGKVVDKLEKFSVLKAIQSISEAHVVVLVLDAQADIAEQDATIVGYALDAGKSIVVAINKWDNLKEEEREAAKYNLKRKLHFLDFAEFKYISALKKRGISEIISAVTDAYHSAFIKMPTSKLTRILIEAVNRQPPAFKGNFKPKMRYAHQGGSNPPIIVIHGNSLDKVAKSYTKYIERMIRKVFNLVGTPIKIEYRSGENPYA